MKEKLKTQNLKKMYKVNSKHCKADLGKEGNVGMMLSKYKSSSVTK